MSRATGKTDIRSPDCLAGWRGAAVLRTGLLLLSLLGIQALLSPLAAGEEVTRSEYVERSEPFCKTNTINSKRILKGIREDIREGRLRRAGRKFSRAADSLAATIDRLEALPQPSSDEARLRRWFAGLRREVRLMERLAARLSDGKSKGLARDVLELRHQANVTNNIVLTFGFEYCLIQVARYL
jgi:hypothetical protein